MDCAQGNMDACPVDIERKAVRAILLTPDAEVLLMRILPPDGGTPFWIAPGGGLEEGETVECGLRRELREELGLIDYEIGPLVWRRQHTFNWAGKRLCQMEQYHIVHVERFDPVMTDAAEARTLDRFHWWRVAELKRAAERLTPLSLADILDRYITQGPPEGDLTVEVLVD